MPWSDINYAQKRFFLRKLTETKEEFLVAAFSSWRIQKKQVVSRFKTPFFRLDRLIHSSFKSIIHYPIAKSRLVCGFKTPLCRPYRTHSFWESKMLKHQVSISLRGCGFYCLEHIFDWDWVQNCVPDSTQGVFFFARKTTFYLQMLDIINDTTKDKNITVSSLWNRILKIWDMLFELIQIETQWNKNYFKFFCNVQLELWNGTLTLNKKSHGQNQQKIFQKLFLEIFDLSTIPSKRQLFWNMSWFCSILVQTFWLWR